MKIINDAVSRRHEPVIRSGVLPQPVAVSLNLLARRAAGKKSRENEVILPRRLNLSNPERGVDNKCLLIKGNYPSVLFPPSYLFILPRNTAYKYSM